MATFSHRYATREAACAALLVAISEVGAKRVDAGLGQLNIGWQRQRFAEPCDALDPYLNLALTTRVLQEHKTPDNNWIDAAGRYHRPAGGEPAARYRKSFALQLQHVTGSLP